MSVWMINRHNGMESIELIPVRNTRTIKKYKNLKRPSIKIHRTDTLQCFTLLDGIIHVYVSD
jgi:hypothetical protein